jgi:hypothetical protein
MASHKAGLKWCPCCKKMRSLSRFVGRNGVMRTVCDECSGGEDMFDYMADTAQAREEARRLKRFKSIFEQRQRGEAGVPMRQEKEYWNLTHDPFPEMFGGMGMHANYCPLM